MILGYLLGGAVGADRTAVGQTLLAHPAVAAPLSAWLVGDPVSGLWLGLVLSMLSHEQLPMGHERLRDHASVAVAIPLALGPAAAASDWGLALLVGALWAWPLALLIQALRELARRILGRARELLERDEAAPLERWHFSFAGLHFARGILAVALSVVLLRGVLIGWHEIAGPLERQAAAWFFLAAPLIGLPAVLREGARVRWLVPGLLVAGLWFWVQGGVR